jgi:vitamin B12/bleomycin/antimicrobial peptide transport system ATP-binding/permease protein
MSNVTDAPAPAAHSESTAAADSLSRQLAVIVHALRASPERMRLVLLGSGLMLVIGGTALAQVRLNAWNKPFYDSLAQKDLPAFIEQIKVFAVIAAILLCLNVTQTWLSLTTKLKLREGLTADLLGQWLQPGRAFRLSSAGEIGVNPDQRLHDDTRNLTELTANLGIGLFQSTLLLFSFIGVLWELSREFVLYLGGRNLVIPGYMVWSALIYAATASFLSWRVGRPLVRLNAERYAREADLRYALMRTSEHVDAITLYGGERDEERRLRADLGGVLAAVWRVVWATTRLGWVTAGYGWFTIVAPIVVAAPAYFHGSLTFGELMVVVGAFNQVQGALRWYIDNFSVIADWRAMLVRVTHFRQALARTDCLDEATEQRIELVPSSEERMALIDLEVTTPGGSIVLKEHEAVIAPGERVAVVGLPGVGKTMLFHAIAGLWPWGRGRIEMPPRDAIAFIPRRPYLPPGLLKTALAYPSGPQAFQDADYVACLKSVGLERFVPALGHSARWDRKLSEEDQQALALARLVLHKPRWIIADDALDLLDPEQRKLVISLLSDVLKDVAVLKLGRTEALNGLFKRVLHIVRDPSGRRFVPASQVGA